MSESQALVIVEEESQVPMYLSDVFAGYVGEHLARKFIRSGQARPCRHRFDPDDAAYEMRLILDPDSAAGKERLQFLKGMLPAQSLQTTYSEVVWQRKHEDEEKIITGRVHVLKRYRRGRGFVGWTNEFEGFRPDRFNPDKIAQPLFRTAGELALSPPLRAAGRDI